MRQIILGLAVSLDGYIEGPNGEYDWCFTDQDYGLSDFMKRIDAVFSGRKTYELTQKMEGETGFPILKEYVFTRKPGYIAKGKVIVSGDILSEVNKIKNERGKRHLAFWRCGINDVFDEF